MCSEGVVVFLAGFGTLLEHVHAIPGGLGDAKEVSTLRCPSLLQLGLQLQQLYPNFLTCVITVCSMFFLLLLV